MEEKNFNLICLNFQEKIIKIFNEEQLPFLIKFYLFKQLWKLIKKEKRKNDINTQLLKTQERSVSAEIPIKEEQG